MPYSIYYIQQIHIYRLVVCSIYTVFCLYIYNMLYSINYKQFILHLYIVVIYTIYIFLQTPNPVKQVLSFPFYKCSISLTSLRSQMCLQEYRNLNLNHIGTLIAKESEKYSLQLTSLCRTGKHIRKRLSWKLRKHMYNIHRGVHAGHQSLLRSFRQPAPSPIQRNDHQKGAP